MTEKRFVHKYDGMFHHLLDMSKENFDTQKIQSIDECVDLLNDIYNENERLKRHIKANTLKKIKVEDIFNCAKYDKFYDNKEAIKSIDWIAEQLGVDFE